MVQKKLLRQKTRVYNKLRDAVSFFSNTEKQRLSTLRNTVDSVILDSCKGGGKIGEERSWNDALERQ